MKLSGAVSDFGESRKLQMKTSYATAVGVSIDQVELLITSASVIATYVTYSCAPSDANPSLYPAPHESPCGMHEGI